MTSGKSGSDDGDAVGREATVASTAAAHAELEANAEDPPPGLEANPGVEDVDDAVGGAADEDPAPSDVTLEPTYTPGELGPVLEAMVFACGSPLTVGDLRRALARHWNARPASYVEPRLEAIAAELERLCELWHHDAARGFYLAHVAQGYSFRTNPDLADPVRDLRAQRPARLSRAALETLSIIAYRQPATKPEVDHIRGVDCGGTIRLLLERSLVRIVGKKEEPGRPLLYGTSREFLSLFNLGTLSHLPSLREYNELSEESAEELAAFEGLTELAQLDDGKSRLALDTGPELAGLDDALSGLNQSEERTSAAFEGGSEGSSNTADEVPSP